LESRAHDDYWIYYLTRDMASDLEVPRPYTNLETYLEHKKRGVSELDPAKEELAKLEDSVSAQDEGESTD
jgi:hypothetical protein